MAVKAPPQGGLDPNFIGDWDPGAKAKVEQARKDLARFQKQTPTFTGVVRAISGNQKARVFPTGNAPHTDGKDVWLRPPAGFGREDLKHNRDMCGMRDDRSVMRCPACQVDDMVLSTIYHECAHLLHDSFADVDTYQLSKHLIRLVKELEKRGYVQEHIDTIVAYVTKASIYGWMAVASAVSPWLPKVVNALEDARVNWANHLVMPGTFHMVRGSVHHTFDDGIKQYDGSVVFWHEQDLDMQAMISTLAVAQGLGTSWFAPEIQQMFVDDDELRYSCESAQRCGDVNELFELAVTVLARLKTHGYCLDNMDYEFYDDVEFEPGQPNVQPPDNKIVFANGSGEGDDDGDEGDDGDDDDGKGSGSGDEADDEDTEEGGSGGDDQGEGDGDEAGDDQGKAGDDQAGEDDSGSQSAGEGGSEYTDDRGNDPDDVVTDVDLDDLKATERTDNGGAGPSDKQLAEVDNAMNLFGGHDEDGDPNFDPSDDLPTPDGSQVQRVVDQGEDFDDVSPNMGKTIVEINDPNESTSDEGLFDSDIPSWRGSFDMEPVPEQVLVGSIARVRKIFKENKQSKRVRGQRSGRITAKHLSRVAVANDRVFNKHLKPDTKDYGVIIGMDCSGSMVDQTRMRDVKTATYAMAELLHRVDIPFEVWAHTAGGWSRGNVQLIMGQVKLMDEPWAAPQKAALNKLVPTAGNLDGHTMEWYRKRAQALRATDKIILYFTDGDMPASNYDEELYILKRELNLIERDPSLKVLAVGVAGNTQPMQYGLDTVLYTGTQDIPKLISSIEERVTVQR